MAWGEFIEKYIFPGGELTHISVVMQAMTNGGLEEVDVENLRPHYARTLVGLERCAGGPPARSGANTER